MNTQNKLFIILGIIAVVLIVIVVIRKYRENFVVQYDELAGNKLNYEDTGEDVEDGLIWSWNNQTISPSNTPRYNTVPTEVPAKMPINPIQNVPESAMSPHYFQDRRIMDTLAIQGSGVPLKYELHKPVFETPSVFDWANKVVMPECCVWSNLSTSGGCIC